MSRRRHKVTVTTDLNALIAEMTPRPMLLVRPLHARQQSTQRSLRVVEVVDLSTLNLLHVESFETV